MKAVTQGANTYTYAYNGVGDRLRQTANGITTNYTLDLNAELTQVLSDGTNAYLYGNGRIAQYQTAMQYFGADALGSVRQLVSDPIRQINQAVVTFQNGDAIEMEYNLLLTRREREIAALITTGASNKEIAKQLAISDKTVKNTLTKVFAKTGSRSRTELAVRLVRSQYGAVLVPE